MTGQSETPFSGHGHPVRRLDTPEAREYAEWCLLVLDLGRCLRVARLWKDTDKARDTEVAVSLFRDAVVSFIACFDTTNTVSLDHQALYGQYEGGIEYFQWLSAIRDTWIAHRHGASRQTSTAIVVDQNSGEFLGLGNLLMTYSRPVLEGADDFVLFVSIALTQAKAKKSDTKAVVESQARSLTPNQRLRLPIANAKAPTGGALRVGRRKFANVTRLTAQAVGRPAPPEQGAGETKLAAQGAAPRCSPVGEPNRGIFS